jgi:hypothetical protein
LYKQPEYANLETLLASEANEASNDFALLAKVLPATIAIIGTLTAIVAVVVQHSLWALLSTLGSGAIAVAVWFIFDHMDKKIPPSRKLIRKQAKKVLERVCGFSNIVGVDPALSPSVSVILDEAASIYLKHRTDASSGPFADNRNRAESALEAAMARLMDLAALPSVREQELELQRGWAWPLLLEMRDMDRTLDETLKNTLANPLSRADDPLAQLRQARLELQSIDTAIDELEQRS